MSDDEGGADVPHLGDLLVREDGLEPCFLCNIHKLKGGFGFNIKGPTADGGQMLSIAGKLLPPLQYISAVETGGAAWRGGVRVHDRVLAVNGVDVMGRSHADIVELVIKGGTSLAVEVLRVSNDEADRMARLEEASEKGVTPKAADNSGVAVRGYSEKMAPSPHTVYKIYYRGSKCAAKRFSDFTKLHKDLQARFRWYTFPPFPKKLSNGIFGGSLSEAAKKQRVRELHQYMVTVMGNEDIVNSEISCTFLSINPPATPSESTPPPTTPLAIQEERNGASPKTSPTSSTAAGAATAGQTEKKRTGGQKLFGEATVFDEEEGGLDDLASPGFTEEEEIPEPKVQTAPKKKVTKPAATKSQKPVVVQKAATPSKVVTGKMAAGALDDDDDDLLPPPKPKAAATPAPKAADAVLEEKGAVAVPKKKAKAVAASAQPAASDKPGITVTILVPGRDQLEVSVPSGANVNTVEAAVAAKLKLGPFAAKAFGLFVRLKDGSLLRKLPPKRKVAKVLDHGELVYRKWLFAKAQEINIDADSEGALLLRDVNREDIASGTLAADEIKDKLDAIDSNESPGLKKYNKLVRKLRLYGTVPMRPCVCDYPKEGTKVILSLHLARLVLTSCNDAGEASVDENDVTEFPWESLASWDADEEGSAIIVSYTTEGDETESIRVELGEDVSYFSLCAKRVKLERDWIKQVAEIEGDEIDDANFFIKKK